MTVNNLKPTNLEDLREGDVINVHFKSPMTEELFIDEVVESIVISGDGVVGKRVSAESGLWFAQEYSTYFVTEKAPEPKRELPPEDGAVVRHSDGWQFVRIGLNNWRGISTTGIVSSLQWRDDEVACTDWEVVA